MFVLVLAISIVACDGNVKQQPVQDTSPTGDTSDGQVNVEETQEIVDAQQEQDDSTEAYTAFKEELQDNPEYEIEYKLIHSNGNEEVVNIYTKEDKTRMDITSSGEEISVWMNGVSVLESQGQCLDLDSAGNFGFDPESIFQKVTVEGSVKTEDKYQEVSKAGTKTIAGKTTQCYELIYKTSQYNQLTTFCLTDKGIPALMKTVDQDSGDLVSEARAQSISDSVSDDVLEPCEPNMDISGLI
ncbi:MAG: hypothetical protein ACQESE_04830 [Nanobdellota archaeon]